MGGCCAPSNRTSKFPSTAKILIATTLGRYRARLMPIRDSYDFIRVIGYGKFGVVREAVDLSGKGASVAIKSIPRSKLHDNTALLMRELQVLHELDHPNIIKLYETFEDEKYLHLVMELCSGGDLHEHICNKGVFAEAEAALIMRKLLLAVNHMHNSYICHRDLKPENILYEGDEIKIADFGISLKFGDPQKLEMTSVVGTPNFVAPEVLQRRYGKECDVWSLGVILYVMLSGMMPFEGQSVRDVLGQILLANFSFADSR
jgi:calcium-dependent protein kinase